MGSLFSKSKDVKHKITEQDLAILVCFFISNNEHDSYQF